MRAPGGFLAKMLPLSRFRSPGAAGRSLDDAIAERLLAGQNACPDASPSQQALALIFKAAARPGTGPELSGEATAVDAFILAATALHAQARARTGKRPLARRTPVLAAAITTALIAGLYGTAAADVLPAPLQRLAHITFGAPAPGRPAPALTGPPHSGGSTPTLSGTASHPATSPVSTGKTSGQSPSPTGKAKATTATTTALSTASNGKHNGKAKANGKPKAKANAKAKPKPKPKANGGNGTAQASPSTRAAGRMEATATHTPARSQYASALTISRHGLSPRLRRRAAAD
jgi:hypothetical protein